MRTWLIASLLTLTACATNPATGELEFDRDLAHRELSALSVDTMNFAGLVEADHPEAAETARKIAAALNIVDDALVEGAEGQDLLDVIAAAVDLIPEVAEVFDDDPDSQNTLRLIVFAVRTVLNHAQALIGQETPVSA
jgi:hypothetical protein